MNEKNARKQELLAHKITKKGYYQLWRSCTSKRTYREKKLAREAIKKSKKWGMKLKIYNCSWCMHYHLTSK